METSEQKDKYYTPTIEEFHVGFEYEWKRDNEGATPWTKSIMQFDTGPIKDGDAWRVNDYRVKYLDLEDIESLDWKLYKQGNVNHFTFRLFENADIQMHISFGSPSKISFSTRSGLESMYFNIKNKSELKKLMIQLNILKDEE